MAAFARSRLRWICALTLGAIAGLVAWNQWHRARAVEPAPPNPFVASVELRRLDDGTRIGEHVTIAPNSGFYAAISLWPNPAPPATLEGHEVLGAPQWFLGLVTYPRGSILDAEGVGCLPCLEFLPPSRLPPALRSNSLPVKGPVGNAAIWPEWGYEGPPEPPAEFVPADGSHLWTYFAVLSAEPGEYVYELLLYPTAKWRSSVRFEKGPSVVLKRGLVNVVAAESSAVSTGVPAPHGTDHDGRHH